MTRNLSVLQRATAADLQLDPFPFIVIPNALPDDLYAELEASFPSPQSMGIKADRNNHRWNYASRKIRRNTALPQVWRDFVLYAIMPLRLSSKEMSPCPAKSSPACSNATAI